MLRSLNGRIAPRAIRRDPSLSPPTDKQDTAPSKPPAVTPELSLLQSRQQASFNNVNEPVSHVILGSEPIRSPAPADVTTSPQPHAETQGADHSIVIDTAPAFSSVVGTVGTFAPGDAFEERHTSAQWDSRSNRTSESDGNKSCPPPYEP